jgi:hypothetical protein
MTDRLEDALQVLRNLPDDMQNAAARAILDTVAFYEEELNRV